MGFGIAIALVWQIDAFVELGVSPTNRLQGIAGQVLTGILVGGFGSGWHEVFDALSSSAKSSRANAAEGVGFSASERRRSTSGELCERASWERGQRKASIFFLNLASIFLPIVR
jgi:hypothetical protein